jgi:hypothetical protein
MGIALTIPISAQPIITGNIFQATFNNPTANRYDFTNTAANQNVVVLPLERWAVYVIERVNFSANIDESVYLEAIDTNGGLPSFQCLTTVAGQQIFPNRQPVINYVDNLEVIQPFWTQQDNDNLLVTFRGLFTQPGAIAGLTTMYTYLQMNIYKIQETQWIKNFFDKKEKLGQNLNMLG